MLQAKLIAIDHVTLSPLIPKRENVLAVTDQNTTVSDLQKNFGSRKMKRQTEQFERMKMNVDDVKQQLEETVQSKWLILDFIKMGFEIRSVSFRA